MPAPDVIIVGAGVIGSAIAYALACATSLRVLVLERGTAGCEASNAAAGVLAVSSGEARQGVLLELRRRSAALFPALVAQLEQETGLALGYRRQGLLRLAFSEAEAVALADLVRHRTQQGFVCEMLSPAAVRALEPAITPTISAGALFPEDAAIASDRLVAALVRAARRRRVEFQFHTPVRTVATDGRTVTLQVDGGVRAAATAIIAAGAWSGEVLAACGPKVPLRPARGEVLAVCPTGWSLRHTVSAHDCYIVARDDHEVFVGSTMAFVGFDPRVTAAGIAALSARAARIVPLLAASVPTRTWAGLRPCPTIRRPIIAPLPGLPNVLLATGHHRNGILLAPITARLVTEILTAAPPSLPLRPFSYRRH